MPRTKRTRRGRPSAIAQLSVAQLIQEMDRRRGMLGSLQTRRADIERELETVTNDIAQIESVSGTNGQPVVRGRGRPKGLAPVRGGQGRGRGGNKKSLAARLHGLLRGRTMNVAQMAEAVKKAGHKSKSKNFNTVVGLALLSHKQMFRRVSRGQYTAK